MPLSLRLWLSALLCAVAMPSLAADPAAASGGVSRALLIGINHYQAVPGLQGSVNDVETMREVLITRWGFAPSNIEMLTDEQATRASIIAALNRIVASAGADDTVYVHYSGHGSQVQDLNGDEDDGLDETIVPQDGRSGDVPDIVDDELDVIFAKLRARSAVVVLDSCHSGTATRAFDIRARSVPQDTRIDLYRTGVTATTMRGIAPMNRSQLVVMSAAADNEEALDGPVDGHPHGFFTYALSRSLASAPPNASPRQIFAGVANELARIQTAFGRTSMPQPQLGAPPNALDSPLFSRAAANTPSEDAPRLAWLDTQPIGSGAVTLVNGLLLGATPGSAWAIYPPNETRFAPGSAVAIATVSALDGGDARATVPVDRTIVPQSRAVAFLPAAAPTRIAIRIGNVPAERRAHLQDVLSRHIAGLQWVAVDQPARFVVDMQGDTVRLTSADGLGVVGSFAIDDERTLENVARVASRTTPAADLLALDNPASRIKVSARVIGAAPVASRDIVLVATTAPAKLHARRSGEPRSAANSLQLAVTVSDDAYLTIVDVDADGAMNVLFPNPYQRPDFGTDGYARGGRELLIPDSLQPGNRAGFYWDYGPPPGIDTVRVFATTDLATANLIRSRIRTTQQPARSRGLGDETPTAAGSLNALRTDLKELATRGIAVVADDSTAPSGQTPSTGSDWAAASVTVEVAP